MSGALLAILTLLYLGVLFAIGYYSERGHSLVKKWANGSAAYVLSLAVYCTAWTFYGSIGRAATSGLDFLAIYLGPVLAMPLWYLITRKSIRIARTHRIGTLADFFSARYGQFQRMATLVSTVLLMAIIPYIALQIKAISESYSLLTTHEMGSAVAGIDSGFVATLILTIFTLAFGTRYLEASRPKRGMIAVVAFESGIKIFVFLLASVMILAQYKGGLGQLFSDAHILSDFAQLTAIPEKGQSSWVSLILISSLAFLLLPRQFQVAVVENRSESHLRHALWLLPLYFLVINLLVFPVALTGRLAFPAEIDPDFYMSWLTMDQPWLSSLVFIGGFSAASSMIIVSTIAMGTMVSNNLIVPALIRLMPSIDFSKKLLWIRRFSILVIMLLSWAYFRGVGERTTLVSIGITSFIGVAQLAPAYLGGLFWKKGNRHGAFAGMLFGLILWFVLLILPDLNPAWSVWEVTALSTWLGVSTTSTVVYLTLLLNAMVYVVVSSFTKETARDIQQAELFVDADKYARSYEDRLVWQGSASFPNIQALLNQFLGDQRAEEVLDRYARIQGVDWRSAPHADAKMISYAERLLAEAIGPASARIMISSVVKEERIGIGEVVNILNESREVLQLNKKLKTQSDQLILASEELRLANEQMKELGGLKDDFLYTVTHELRTPLTSIRAQAEILHDEPEMLRSDQEMFLNNIVEDCERLTRLITNVLDLEKFESGNLQLDQRVADIAELLDRSISSMHTLGEHHNIQVKMDLARGMRPVFIDQDRITQVIVNLLSNAMKFANPADGHIRISAYEIDGEVKVNIIDNGPGISQEDAERVFDKFYQVRHQLTNKPKGTGLGLAICKNIIQSHGGVIYLRPEKKGGTRASFTLPISRHHQQKQESHV
ncbi:histidine kinase [Cryomorphaceae bacterium]|nr:histidine kinase [Cryomorphaceae bacterium]